LPIVAVENEIGNRSQRAAKIGCPVSVQAGLGARGEIMRRRPRAVERA